MLGIVFMSDLLDGYFARKWKIETDLGLYFDVFADFFLVVSVFYVFALLKLYPLWIEFVFVGMFVQFLLSSKGKLRYDPVGKHYGTFLFVVILISAFHVGQTIYNVLTICIIIASIVTIIGRYLILK